MSDSTFNIIKRASLILDKKDRRKAFSLVFVHSALGLLDILAVLILGLLGSLTVTGVSANQPGNRVKGFLELIRISEFSLQTQVALLGILSATLLVGRSLISLYLSKKVIYFLSRRSAVITSSLLKGVLKENLVKLNLRNVQELIHALTTGVNAVTGSILGAAAVLVADIFLVFAFTTSLFFIDPYIALSSLILFSGVALMLYLILYKRAQVLGETATAMTISSNQKIYEVISNYRELLVKNRRNYYAKQISAARLEMSDSIAQMALFNFLSKYVIEISLVFGGLCVAAIQFSVNPASRAVAVIAIFLVSSTRIAPAVLRIQSGLVTIRNNIGMAKPTLDLIEEYTSPYSDFLETEFVQESRKSNSTDFLPEVILNGVSFSYPKSAAVNLKNVTLHIQSGEFIGVIGSSGAGKTTLVDLLLGVLEPSKGTVLISGKEPRESFASWPGLVAYVPQETKLIKGSLKDNVCLGFDAEEFEDQKIEDLLQKVQLSELLNNTTEGVHVRIGEGGKGLSGGQKQRIGIARALLTDPKLLILDESTSALDMSTEKKIMSLIDSRRGHRTVIMITHRLATIKEASRIIYIESGEIMGFDSLPKLRLKFPLFDELFKAARI